VPHDVKPKKQKRNKQQKKRDSIFVTFFQNSSCVYLLHFQKGIQHIINDISANIELSNTLPDVVLTIYLFVKKMPK
jgi:succinate dehydrogenase hydrophobic anchor subunit